MALLNIGLARDGQENVDPWVALDMAKIVAGVRPVFSVVYQSDTEPTLVIETRLPVQAYRLNQLAEVLEQDCVAQWDGKRGELIGPRAEKWLPFDPHYFINVDGTRLA